MKPKKLLLTLGLALVLLVNSACGLDEVISNNSENSDNFVSTEEWMKLSEEIEAEKYIEISSKEQKNLMNVIRCCVKIWKKKNDMIENDKESKCVINWFQMKVISYELVSFSSM